MKQILYIIGIIGVFPKLKFQTHAVIDKIYDFR